MITFLDDEIARRLSSARAWTKLGQGEPDAEWARKIQTLEAMLRLFNMIEANPEAKSAIAKTLRERK